jgi:hypothetical protein
VVGVGGSADRHTRRQVMNEEKGRPIPAYADMFTMQEFLDMVKSRILISWDGSGRYASETEMFTSTLKL